MPAGTQPGPPLTSLASPSASLPLDISLTYKLPLVQVSPGSDRSAFTSMDESLSSAARRALGVPEILGHVFLELDSPWAFTAVSRAFHATAKKPINIRHHFERRYYPSEILFELIRRPSICTAELAKVRRACLLQPPQLSLTDTSAPRTVLVCCTAYYTPPQAFVAAGAVCSAVLIRILAKCRYNGWNPKHYGYVRQPRRIAIQPSSRHG